MRSTLTFDEYDKIEKRVCDNSFKADGWWPTVEEIKTKIEPDFSKNIEFLIWIISTNTPPQNPEEVASKNYINALLRKRLNLVESRHKSSDSENTEEDE